MSADTPRTARPMEEFEGADENERWINWYLTNQFVISDAPPDECLGEARAILEHLGRAPASASPPELEALKEQVNHWYMLYHAAADQIEQSKAAPRFTEEQCEAVKAGIDALDREAARQNENVDAETHMGLARHHMVLSDKAYCASATLRAMLSPQGKGGET